jgi:TonB family protein
MDAKRTRRLLIVAFALSLLIHAIVASGIRWRLPEPTEEEQVVHVQRVTRQNIPRPPSPPPFTPPPHTPAPSPVHATPAAKPRGKPSTRGIHGVGPGALAATTPAPIAAPTAVAATSAPCKNSDLPAELAASPTPPDIAPQVRAQATNGITKVRVALDASGNVQDASVVQTSGNTSLDLVALTMAKSAQYTPAYHDCKAVAGTYDFSARFIAW